MAGFEEVAIKDITNSKVANDGNMLDNEVDEKDLDMSEEELDDLVYTDPVEFERIQAGGEVNA